MAGRYVTLVAAQNYLEGEGSTGFVTARAIACEAVADLRIDADFNAWDRTAWINGAAPPEIALVALKLASAEYMRRGFNKSSPDADVPGQAKQLIAEVDNDIQRILGRGYLHAGDGTNLYPASQGSGSIFARVAR